MHWKDLIGALVDSGLTQVQIAEQAGCQQNTVSDLSTGKTKEPRGSLAFALMRLCRRRGLRVPAIIERTPDEVRGNPLLAESEGGASE